MTETQTTLMDQLSRTIMLLHRYQMQSMRDRGPIADPNRGQGRVLALLNLQPEISQKDLAYLLGIRNQSLSELLAKLEKAGYVTKEPSEEDKRVMNVKLTDEGKKAANQTERQQKDIGDVFGCLSEEEQQNLSDYLGRLVAELEKEMGEEIPDFDAFCDEKKEHLRAMFGRFRGYGGRDFDGFGKEGEFPDFGCEGGRSRHPRGAGFSEGFDPSNAQDRRAMRDHRRRGPGGGQEDTRDTVS